jgi:anti-sigma-K factor RskA
MKPKHIDDLVDAYALGALAPEEASEVEQHMHVCEPCRILAELAQDTADQMLLAGPDISPPTELRAAVLNRIQRAEQDDPRTPAGAPVAEPTETRRRGGFSGLLTTLFGKPARSEADLTALLRDLLAEPDARIIPLTGTDSTPEATGQIVVSANRHEAVLVTYGLPVLATAQRYQVWALRGADAVPGTLFTVNHAGEGAGRISTRQPLRHFDSVAVSREPQSGSRTPSGPIVLSGSLR